MSFLECLICNENFDDADHIPRLLLCGHTFCSKCLEASNMKKCIVCPTCRQKTSVENAITDLVPNHQLSELIGSISDFRNIAKCEDCKEQPATCWCEECEFHYCADCEKLIHRGALRNHERTVPENRATSTCKTHKRENLSFFCLDCDSPICSLCRDHKCGTHSTHNVDLIDQVDSLKRKSLLTSRTKVIQTIEDLEKLSAAVATAEIDVGTNQSKAVKFIDESFEILTLALKKRRKVLLKLVREQATTGHQKLHQQRSETAKTIASLMVLKEETHRLSERGTLAMLQLFSSLSNRVETATKEVDATQKNPCVGTELIHHFPQSKTISLIESHGSMYICGYSEPIVVIDGAETYEKSLEIKWNVKAGVPDAFIVEYRLDESKSDWEIAGKTSKQSLLVNGLKTATAYEFRVCGLSKEFPDAKCFSETRVFSKDEFMIEGEVDGEFVLRSNVRPWNDFQIGDIIDARDVAKKWYESTIRDLKDYKGLLIHFNGWPVKWDEWIKADSDKLAKRGTHTSGEYKPGRKVKNEKSQEGAPDVNLSFGCEANLWHGSRASQLYGELRDLEKELKMYDEKLHPLMLKKTQEKIAWKKNDIRKQRASPYGAHSQPESPLYGELRDLEKTLKMFDEKLHPFMSEKTQADIRRKKKVIHDFERQQEFIIEGEVDGEFVRRSNVRPWNDFQIGDIIDVRDVMKKWYESTIIDLKDDKGLLIHFNGWTGKWDEWIKADSDKLAKRGTHTSGEYKPRKKVKKVKSQEGAPDVSWNLRDGGSGQLIGHQISDNNEPESVQLSGFEMNSRCNDIYDKVGTLNSRPFFQARCRTDTYLWYFSEHASWYVSPKSSLGTRLCWVYSVAKNVDHPIQFGTNSCWKEADDKHEWHKCEVCVKSADNIQSRAVDRGEHKPPSEADLASKAGELRSIFVPLDMSMNRAKVVGMVVKGHSLRHVDAPSTAPSDAVKEAFKQDQKDAQRQAQRQAYYWF